MKKSDQVTIADVIAYLMPQALDGVKPAWPPDLFALCASILKQSGAYTEIVNRWPPDDMKVNVWTEGIKAIAVDWRKRYETDDDDWPPEVDGWWAKVLSNGSKALNGVRSDTDLLNALASLVSVADEVAFRFGIPVADDMHVIENEALTHLDDQTLCRYIHPSRARVLPKLHNSLAGMTIRSLTHNLALWDRSEVDARWLNVPNLELDELNIVIVPFPLSVRSDAFRSLEEGDCSESMPEAYGLFTYDIPPDSIKVDVVKKIIEKSRAAAGTVHAVVFPELSMTREQFDAIRGAFPDLWVVAGAGEPAQHGKLGKNEVVVGFPNVADPLRQSKHHRWQLDDGQVEQYGIETAINGKNYYWEAIEMGERVCTFVNFNEWLTFCVLICEDLARQDPVAELVRSVGPNLVIALLMDGPQISQRWSARYATVLAEDPRSSVLTVSSAGLVDRANAARPGAPGPRSVCLWRDPMKRAPRQITLDPRASAIVLELRPVSKTEWTADGRDCGGHTYYPQLAEVHQVVI